MKRLSCLHEAVKATRQLCLLVTSMNGKAEIVADEMALRINIGCGPPPLTSSRKVAPDGIMEQRQLAIRWSYDAVSSRWIEPGDPEIFDRLERYPTSGALGPVPGEVDVIIVGCGPAGLTLAAQLSAFPDIKTCIVEQKPGRKLLGQADGIACRTMEMFHAFGFSERVLKEGCWITETTFWKPDDRQP